MMTVKEISDLTGISIRTLHYYDEIGLLKPTAKNDTGYRLYDDKALETLQQILFFREFEIPLKEIKAIMARPDYKQNQILQIQREMLTDKKARIERLIANIDDILRGTNKMDFEVFHKTDIEKLFRHTLVHLPENALAAAIKEFGSIKKWEEHYLELASQETMQKGYQKLAEWYGGRDTALNVLMTPPDHSIVEACQKQLDTILEQLGEKRDRPLDSIEIQELIGAYTLVMKQLARMDSEAGLKHLMLSVANSYRHELVKPKTDERYGEGTADFFAQAIERYFN